MTAVRPILKSGWLTASATNYCWPICRRGRSVGIGALNVRFCLDYVVAARSGASSLLWMRSSSRW
jgi:hypothetical protein